MFEYYQQAGALEKYIWFYGTQIKKVFAMKGRLKKSTTLLWSKRRFRNINFALHFNYSTDKLYIVIKLMFTLPSTYVKYKK